MENISDVKLPLWREKDGIVYFSVQSTGTTTRGWGNKFQSRNGYSLWDGSTESLDSSDFKTTKNVIYNIALLRSWHVGHFQYLQTRHIFTEGKRRGLKRMTPEAMFLMRELLSDNDIVSRRFNWIVAMHTPLIIQQCKTLLSIPAEHNAHDPKHKRRIGCVFLGNTEWQRAFGGWAFLVSS